MSDNQTGFDQEYVSKLREEAAGYRTQLREAQAQLLYKDVEVELANQGIKADPTWVEIKENQSVADAVKDLVNKHPHLAPQTTTQSSLPPEPVRPMAPRPMAPGAPQSESPANPMHSRSMEEIKKDPVARSKLRDLYRAKLAQSSNQPPHEY